MSLKVYHELEQLPLSLPYTAVAIGNFDGIHLGHAEVLKNVVKNAKLQKLMPSVLTFFPHPLHFLKPEVKLETLTTVKEKLDLLEELGIELVLATPFDKKLAQLPPQEFFNLFLKNGLRAKAVHVGSDFCFGRDRSGNVGTMSTFTTKEEIQLHIEPPFLLGKDRVSSSLIRNRIRTGDVERATRFLGRPYTVGGTVVHGDGRGKTIGIPTANILFPLEKVLPRSGVYVTQALWQKQIYKSVTNVGIRPTFSAQKTAQENPVISIETHILDFTHRIYDEHLELRFLKFIRDEVKFSDLESLISQIKKDIDTARHYTAP